MSLNIKNEETHRLATQLARMTGESMTQAVDKAIRERIARLRKTKHKVNLAERLLAIGRETAKHMKKPMRSEDHGAMLYDEKGLPK